ncbi:MAG TPA: insulinase family protein [Bacteroidales bacterium]|nr:insulinase family protein [Bacteroidales bacterium]
MALKGKKRYRYVSVPGDTLKVRIYTLANGLKVYFSVHHDAPRIQTYIAVRAGSKMDPPETTGLAHYFEHMMFKGTEAFGTSGWKKERPLIREISELFEQYRAEKNEARRTGIYRKIDRLSFQASRIAIPNEYDKMMDAIGSQGSNAGTSADYTLYMENIPSNEIRNWAIIQAERFSRPVLRLFHTELETVYEEKNMSLTNDGRKVSETLLSLLFPDHPYGRQTTLGKTEHLKNPSMKNITEFFRTYYVPNNMAICMAGEFEPDEAIEIIDRYFGKLKSRDVAPLRYARWKPLQQPVTREVAGLESEYIRIGFGFDIRAKDDRSLMVDLAGTLLSNGKTGLLDVNLSQTQRLISPSGYANQFTDYAMILLGARPVDGQTLEQARDLLLEQVTLLRKGKFPASQLEAAVNNARFNLMKQYQTSQGRAIAMAGAFVDRIPWNKYSDYPERMEKVTRKEIAGFADRFMSGGYAVVLKRQEPPADEAKIVKPPITPIVIHRDRKSEFFKKIQDAAVSEIAPVFVDYDRDILKFNLNGNTRVLYRENNEDGTFQLTYYFRTGRNSDRLLNFALGYLPYLGTSSRSLSEINREFYRMACSFTVNAGEEETQLNLTGLHRYFEPALSLMEELLDNPRPDPVALEKLVSNTLMTRKSNQTLQAEVFSALVSYGTYGPKSPYKHQLSEKELRSLSSAPLVRKIRELKRFSHQVLYYGPEKPDRLIRLLEKHHRPPSKPKTLVPSHHFRERPTREDRVLFVHYDAAQTRLQSIVRDGKYDPSLAPVVALHNNYFGTHVIFQELREKRAMAYTAYSRYLEPATLEKHYLSVGFVATQNDKVTGALTALNGLYDRMPSSGVAFGLARNTVLNRIRTDRLTRMNILWNYINAEKLGLTRDIREEIFHGVTALTENDLKEFHDRHLRNRTKTYVILGREPELNLPGLEKFGPVTRLTLEDIFGY